MTVITLLDLTTDVIVVVEDEVSDDVGVSLPELEIEDSGSIASLRDEVDEVDKVDEVARIGVTSTDQKAPILSTCWRVIIKSLKLLRK